MLNANGLTKADRFSPIEIDEPGRLPHVNVTVTGRVEEPVAFR